MMNEKTFAEQVDESLNGKIPFYSALRVCDTPSIFLTVGCEQLPMLFTQRHLKDAVTPKSENNIHFHGLTVEQMKRLPLLIADPLMVYDSLSRNDSIIAVTSELDNDGLPIIVSVRPNGTGRYEMKTLNSNFITSVHGRNDFMHQIEQAFKNNKILFFDKIKSQAMFERWGLQLPELTNSLDSNVIIRQSGNIVKGHFKFEHQHEEQMEIIDKVQQLGLYENTHQVPEANKVTRWFGDYAMYEPKLGVEESEILEKWNEMMKTLENEEVLEEGMLEDMEW